MKWAQKSSAGQNLNRISRKGVKEEEDSNKESVETDNEAVVTSPGEIRREFECSD